jgi:class 3 adenylate cyclase
MSTSKGLVLVVDDNHINRILLATSLEEEGYAVQTANNGREALERLHETPFDVMLLDLLMPEMDGYQLLAHTRADEHLRHIPVIIISALDEMGSVVRCIEMGATDYLTKPFDPVLLRARLNASLASKRLHDLEVAHLRAIQAERERADQLLLNILPEPIAEKLKRGQEHIVEAFPDITVAFADVEDFTPWAARHRPEELLELLNLVFSAFDQLAVKYGVEKIKTIGDEYMVACGLPAPRPDHAEAVARFTLEMRSVFLGLPIVQREGLSLRIGLNCGPVVAGVIGTRKFIYDLWGDTVNVASRMQTHCPTGEIQVSEALYRRLAGEFDFTEQGEVEIKSKGFMHTYLLKGER